MIASQIVVCFAFFGLLGWVFESTYCSLVEKRWCNRGFLFGPVCPIYGAGAVAAILVFGGPGASAAQLPWWAVFLACAVGASCIEWVTSVVLEQLFGTVWWDYSDMPLNLRGRVCVPAAALFGLCGLGVVYVALPLARQVVAAVPPLAFELAALALTAVLAADSTLTVCTLTEVLAVVEGVQAEFDQRMQAAVKTRHRSAPGRSACARRVRSARTACARAAPSTPSGFARSPGTSPRASSTSSTTQGASGPTAWARPRVA